MNEFEKLINYLHSVIDSIDDKKRNIQESNVQSSLIKVTLEKIIELINNHRLSEINMNELSNALVDFIPNDELDSIKIKLTELLSMESFLFNDIISNPIKEIMLSDLEKIKNKLISISANIVEMSIPDEDINLQEKCQKYLSFVSRTGYTRVLTDEERMDFYSFLKSSNLEDKLLLVSKYIIYANSNKKRLEINTSNTAIDIVNKNAKEVVKELEEKIKVESEKKAIVNKAKLVNKSEPVKDEKQKQAFKDAYDKIIELLNIHENDINPATYDVYKNYFMELDIYDIYSRRSSFSTVDGINWEIAIPCIKEKLLPNINSDDWLLILQLFNEIIALNQDELERYRQKREQENEYHKHLNEFKQNYLNVLTKFDTLKLSVSIIVQKVLKQMRTYNQNIDSLIDAIKSSNATDEGMKEYLAHFGITYEELNLYIYYSTIENHINEINEYISLDMLSEDDFKGIYDLLEDTVTTITECNEYYQMYTEELSKEISEDNQDEESTEENKKQYEYGESIIVFFRKDEESKFLVEEDINNQLVDEESYSDIHNVLRRTSVTTHEMWGKALSDSTHFKSFIDYNKQNGGRGDTVTLESDYSHKKYEFFRLKDKGKTYPRLSAFEISMCDENRKKLGIPSNKPIILIIGEKQVTKYSNESQDYSDVRRELRDNYDAIKNYITLFENPNTNEEILYKILLDSSELYDYFKEKAKGTVKKK